MPRFATLSAQLSADVGALERWLLPGECLLCQRSATDDDSLICGICRSRFRPVPAPGCPRCGQPTEVGVTCRICQSWPPELRQAQSAVWMDELARQAVHLFKYEGWWRLADSLAKAMRRLSILGQPATLVPIPLGSSRERTRGYNQSAMLARSTAKLLNVAADVTLLRRTRETPTQTRLTPEARAANVRGAFHAVRRAPARAIIVDDVFTTGATVASAAAALIEAGAIEVACITFARAELPLAGVSRKV